MTSLCNGADAFSLQVPVGSREAAAVAGSSNGNGAPARPWSTSDTLRLLGGSARVALGHPAEVAAKWVQVTRALAMGGWPGSQGMHSYQAELLQPCVCCGLRTLPGQLSSTRGSLCQSLSLESLPVKDVAEVLSL
jgi:hypothetical protein